MPLLDLYPWSTALSLSLVAFLFSVIWGRPLIGFLKRRGIGKHIRVDGPQSHQVKMGTPTMGGWLFISGVVVITIALNIINLIQRTMVGRSVLVPLGTMVVFGLLGAIDDWEGIKGKRIAEGLTARVKLVIQIALALVVSLVLYYGLDIHSIALPTIDDRIDPNDGKVLPTQWKRDPAWLPSRASHEHAHARQRETPDLAQPFETTCDKRDRQTCKANVLSRLRVHQKGSPFESAPVP